MFKRNTARLGNARSRVLATLVMVVAMAASIVAIGAPPAQAATLWTCYTDWDPGRNRACTVIDNAPSTGVRVLDRYTGNVVTLHNGNSVVLNTWKIDDSGRCGINGDRYVWTILWVNSSGRHWGVVGDWYVDTGAVRDWNDFPDYYGHLGDNNHYMGHGSGTCDVFPF